MPSQEIITVLIIFKNQSLHSKGRQEIFGTCPLIQLFKMGFAIVACI
jgi:hypothetical protein